MSTDTFLSRNIGLKEPVCDPDGLYEGCLIPRNQYRLLFYICWITMMTGLIGIWHGWNLAGLATCIASVFGQLYWSYPTYSWRRNLDIAWLHILFPSHFLLALHSPVLTTYVIIQLLGFGLYAISWWFMKLKSSWAATLCHIGLHICANLSALILYLSVS